MAKTTDTPTSGGDPIEAIRRLDGVIPRPEDVAPPLPAPDVAGFEPDPVAMDAGTLGTAIAQTGEPQPAQPVPEPGVNSAERTLAENERTEETINQDRARQYISLDAIDADLTALDEALLAANVHLAQTEKALSDLKAFIIDKNAKRVLLEEERSQTTERITTFSGMLVDAERLKLRQRKTSVPK